MTKETTEIANDSAVSGSRQERLVNVRRWRVDWWAWIDGARIPSGGTEYVDAATKLEAEAILKARYPGIDRLEAH